MPRKSKKQIQEDLGNAMFRYIQVFCPENHRAMIVLYGMSGRIENLIEFLDAKVNEQTKEKE